ncbi:helix-turn-helix transcriptional regulator [Agrococcus sp. KRD186]|uniref:helix-turn-helix transcriptional regulator n=1 Tax=Agrococcus sp. KRD186 TaxID=2729730 RepID=UPI001F4938DE|nr:transcriptional regulator [Agrococcus sp. KRD186]
MTTAHEQEQPMPLDDDVTAVGAIADDARHELYRYVVAQPQPVGREEAAAAVEMPVHRARFHLEKLEQAGLLETDYARPAGRGGPGAGRPAKRYRRADRTVAVSLPPREYDLAGSLLATAIDAAAETCEPVTDAVARVATARGRALGTESAARRERGAAAPAGVSGSGAATADRRVDDDDALHAAAEVLAEHGYEPRRTERGIELTNCPFHELSRAHTTLVCGMNRALLDGVTETVAPGTLRARLDPAPGRCCVVIESADP